MELLRPILELGVVIPGMLLAYFPVKSSLKQPLSKLVLWLAPLLTLLCAAGGVMCYARRMPTAPMLAGLTLLAVVICIKTLRISLWKSGTIALSVCAVFACINSLSRAINAAMLADLPQARHDLRHQLCQLAALAEEGNLEKIKAYLSGAVSRIPSLEMHFCENRAADSVVGYYCALAKRENIPYSVQIDLPECLPVDEINLCLVLSNLLENALEASLRTAPARRRIKLTAYLHGNSLALIQVENTYDGVIREKGGVFQSSKRKGDGVGLQSVRHIAEKSGGVNTVTYQDGLFCVKVMLCG